MEFEWDEDKNRRNIAKHGVSFEQAQKIFDGWTSVGLMSDLSMEKCVKLALEWLMERQFSLGRTLREKVFAGLFQQGQRLERR
ncbi:BrnT family toxin [Hoeflea sp. CAU 1731]